jgi:hypothetical protein
MMLFCCSLSPRRFSLATVARWTCNLEGNAPHFRGVTRNPLAAPMFGMLSVFSEFERSIIRERVVAGMRGRRRRGRRAVAPSASNPSSPASGHPRRFTGLAELACELWLNNTVLASRLFDAVSANKHLARGGSVRQAATVAPDAFVQIERLSRPPPKNFGARRVSPTIARRSRLRALWPVTLSARSNHSFRNSRPLIGL